MKPSQKQIQMQRQRQSAAKPSRVASIPRPFAGLIAALTCSLIATASLWMVSVEAFEPIVSQGPGAPQDEGTDPGKGTLPHGPIELLSELLIRDRLAENSIRAFATNNLSLEEKHFEDLDRIFAQTSDALQVDHTTGDVTSIRRKALKILMYASTTVQKRWIEAHEEFAKGSLQQASNVEQFLSVERRYPLTRSGLQAGLTATTLLHLNGLSQYADTRLQVMEREIHGSILQSEFAELSKPIRSSIVRSFEKTGVPEPLHESTGPRVDRTSAEISLTSISDAESIAPAWPQKSWQWMEMIETFPNAPQPLTAETLLPFVRNSPLSLGDFNNWRPVLTKECLIHRTPVRIVAIDPTSGQELWSLPTDTIRWPKSDPGANQSNSKIARMIDGRQDVGQIAIRDLQAFGLMSADSSHLYFLDHMPLIDARPSESEIINQPFLNDDSSSSLSVDPPQRLVALKLNGADLPQVAWTAGGPSSNSDETFSYHIVKSIEDQPRSEASVNHGQSQRKTQSRKIQTLNPQVSDSIATKKANSDATQSVTPTFDGHQFLSPPCGLADQLFVMTEHTHQTYLSCLAKPTGRILWQKPLAYIGRRTRNMDASNATRGTCLVSSGVLVCVLHDGIAVGVRPADGELLWATGFADPRPADQIFQFQRGLSASHMLGNGVSVVPASNATFVALMHPNGTHVVGIDPNTGRVRWQVARTAVGSASIDGEIDHYIAGLTDSQVIMIGQRHCRALDVQTGDQLWTMETPESSGRAEMSQNRCLLPQQDGQLVTIDLTTGTLHRSRQRFLPELVDEPWGAIVSTDSRIFAVTPVSVTSFLRCDAALSRDELLATIDSGKSALTKARLLLLNHQEEQAIALLRDEVLKARDRGDASTPNNDQPIGSSEAGVIHRTLAEVILQRWADLYVKAVTESRSIDGFGGVPAGLENAADQEIPGSPETRVALENYGSSEDALMLGELDLDSDQQLRSAVLALLSRPGFVLSEEDLVELESFPEWSQSLPLTDDWSVRPDLLLSRFINSSGTMSGVVSSISVSECQRLAEKAILFPEMLRDEAQTEALVSKLIQTNNYAAAEAVLLVCLREFQSTRAAELLESLRSDNHLPKGLPASAEPRGFTTVSTRGQKVRFDTMDSLTPISTAIMQDRIDGGLQTSSTLLPLRLPYDVLIGESMDSGTQMSIADQRDGAILSAVKLPDRVTDNVQSFSPMLYRDQQPSMIPLTSIDSLIMVNCTKPGHPSVLWNKQAISNDDSYPLLHEIEFGPLGAEYMVWHAEDVLHCTHPLTGKELWSRRLRLKPAEAYVAGMRRIFGDDQVIVVMSEDNTRFERYRTRDGQLLGMGVLNPGPNCDAMTIGRFLVYCNPAGRVCLFDGKTGRDRLADQAPIFRLTSVAPQTFFALSNDRVLTVTDDNHLLILNVVSGQVECRVPVQHHLVGDEVFAYTVFEQQGRLYVGIEDELDMHRDRFDGVTDDLPQIRYGILFCVDPKLEQVVWNKRLQNKRFIKPSGDSTDVLIAVQDMSYISDDEEVKRSQIRITLIDGITGNEIAEEAVSSRFPYRVTHYATERLLEFVTLQSVTQISIEPPDAKPVDAKATDGIENGSSPPQAENADMPIENDAIKPVE